MTELCFHRALYPGEALDDAIRRFERFATIERDTSDTHWIVRLSARSATAERRVAGELCNYALGLTVRGGLSAGL